MTRTPKTAAKKTYEFQVVIEIDEDGKYVAGAPRSKHVTRKVIRSRRPCRTCVTSLKCVSKS
jgi:hypothetical protein